MAKKQEESPQRTLTITLLLVLAFSSQISMQHQLTVPITLAATGCWWSGPIVHRGLSVLLSMPSLTT